MKALVVWLVKPFDGLGAFAVGPGCEIVDERNGSFTVRLGARVLGVPLTNVAGVEYSTDEEAAAPALPQGAGASPPVEPAPVTMPERRPQQGKRR